jgi:hypothetical protein
VDCVRKATVTVIMVTAMSLAVGTAWGDKLQQTVTVEPADLFIGQSEGYDVIELEGYCYPTEPGEPMLPNTVVTVTLPGLVEITGLEVASTETEERGGTYRVMPSQVPQPISGPVASGSIGFTPPDPRIYESSQPYPESVVELVNTADLNGRSLAHVRIAPVQYIPREGRLVINRKIEYIIHYQDVIPGEPRSVGLPPGDYDYVIVTSSSLVDAFMPLADWKTKKGVQAIVVTRDDVQNWYGGTGTSDFRSFVQDAHEVWGAAWILLGGDVDIVPEKWQNFSGVGSTYGDTYYADYDGDWVCEVAVGRASVNNTTEVETFVNKVLLYEKDPPLTDYPQDVTLIGMDLDSSTYCERSFELYIVPKIPERFVLTKIYDSDSGDHESTAIDAFNNGQNVSIHMDHSGTGAIGIGWVNHRWLLESSELSDFSNYGTSAIMYTGGCHPGDYEVSDCFGEYWVFKHPDKVGIGFIGNAGYGWYQRGCCSCLSGQYMVAFAKSLFDEGHHHLGDALNDHKNDTPPGSGHMEYVFYELNLLGDPEMPVWLNAPGIMTVTHPTEITLGEQEFTVTVENGSSGIEGARVCLMKDGEVYEVGITDSSGKVTLAVIPTSGGTMSITVTSYDYVPYEGDVVVVEVPVTLHLLPAQLWVPREGTLDLRSRYDNWTDGLYEVEVVFEIYEPGEVDPSWIYSNTMTFDAGATNKYYTVALPGTPPVEEGYLFKGMVIDPPGSGEVLSEKQFEFGVRPAPDRGRSHSPEVKVASPGRSRADTLWTKTCGGVESDCGYAVIQTTDEGYLVVGTTESFGEDGDVYLVRMDCTGNTLWTKTYGYSGGDMGCSVIETTDGGYLVAGSRYTSGGWDIYLIRTDANGDLVWDRTYGGSEWDGGSSVVETADGGFMVAGSTWSWGEGRSDVYLMRIDSNGDILWAKTYGGLDYDEAHSIVPTADGNYMVAGHTESYGAGESDVYVIAIDSTGDTLWTRTYGGLYDDVGYSACQAEEGGLLVAGWTDSYGAGWSDVLLLKIDAKGDLLWMETYGGPENDIGRSVDRATDDEYFVAGYSYSYGAGGADVYVVKTNDAGDLLGARTYGGPSSDKGWSVAHTVDNACIVAGYTESFGAGESDVYLVRLKGLPVSLVPDPAQNWVPRLGTLDYGITYHNWLEDPYTIEVVFEGYLPGGSHPAKSFSYILTFDPGRTTKYYALQVPNKAPLKPGYLLKTNIVDPPGSGNVVSEKGFVFEVKPGMESLPHDALAP